MPKHNDKWSKEEYKNFILNSLRESATVDAFRRVKIADAFDYYYGRREGNDYDQLLTLHEVSSEQMGKTPFVKLNLDSISPKVQALLGDLSGMGFEVSARAINREAAERKMIYENQLRYMAEMQPVFRSAQQYTGLSAGVNNNIPTSPDALKAYMDSYVDPYERLMTAGINDDVDRQMYRYHREGYLLDLLASGEVHAKVEYRDGYLKIRRVNPLKCLPDTSTEDDFASDQSRFFEAYYLSIPECIKRYDMEESDMKEILDSYKKDGSYNGVTANLNGRAYNLFAPFERRGKGWKGYEYDRILVIEGEWLDVEIRSQKVTYNGEKMFVNEYIDDPRKATLKGFEKNNPNNSTTHKKVEVVRKGVLIGGEKLVDWGKTGTYVRSKMNPCRTRLNYVSLFHSYNDQTSVSLIDRMGRIQDFKNYVQTLIQKEITKNIGSFVAIDMSRMDNRIYGDPGKKAINNLLLELKAYGILAYDSAKGGFGADPNAIPFKQIPSQSQTIVSDLINMLLFLDQEMKNISGVNEARMGQFGERTLKSTAQLGQQASYSMTATYFNSFMGWEKNLFSLYAQMKAMVWAEHPDQYEEVAINYGIHLPDDFEIDGQTYECFIQTAPMSQQELKNAAFMAMNGGHLSVPDFLDIMEIAKENRREAYEALKKAIRAREEMMQQRGEQMEIAKIQADQQGKELDYRKEIDKANVAGQWNFKAAQVRSDAQVGASQIKAATDEVIKREKHGLDAERNKIDRFKAINESMSEGNDYDD